MNFAAARQKQFLGYIYSQILLFLAPFWRYSSAVERSPAAQVHIANGLGFNPQCLLAFF